MAYKKLFKELFEQYTAKYKRKPKGLELIKIKLKAADLQREADKLIEFPRNKIQPLDPDDALPNYKETPGEYSRRETPGSIENLREEMKIAYRNEFDRLTGNETAEELTEMLKNLDIDGVPFAGGGVVKKIIKSLTMKNKDPMDSMKELNEVLKRKKELDLSDDQVDEIMEAGNEWIFQRDPDNLFIPSKTDDIDISQGMIDLDELNFTSNAKAAKEAIDNTSDADLLMRKYPGMNIKLATQIANDTNPERKANVIAMVEQTMEMSGKGMGGDEIIEIFKKTPRTKQAGGGLLKKVLKDYQKYLKTRKERPSKKRFKEIPFRKFFEIYGPENFADGGQATSTGLNYLLGEDDTNSRVPYATGGRRGFLKLLAGLGAAGAAFKTGLMSLSKGAAKPAAKVAAEQVAKSGAPPHFFKLVAKIKALGDDITETAALAERQNVKKYKDFELTEDIATGKQEIIRYKQSDEATYYGQPLTEETYMSYTPGETIIGKGNKPVKTLDDYEEGTSFIRNDRGYTGEVVDESNTIADDILKEVEAGSGNVPESFYTGPNAIKKADGGRIDRSGGGIMKIINKLKNKLKVKQSGNSIKDFVDKRKFLKSMVGETEKNKKARELKMLKEAMEEARENPGFKFKDIDVDKEIKPIFDQSKDRTLNAGGGIITKLIKKLNTIDPGSTKRGKLSKPMSKKAKDKKELREAIENFSKRNRAR